jgi:hypothetical protein
MCPPEYYADHRLHGFIQITIFWHGIHGKHGIPRFLFLEQKAAAPVVSAQSVPSKKGTHKGCPYGMFVFPSPAGGTE